MSTPVTRKAKKKKIGTILDENVIRTLKERAIAEGKTMSMIIEEAVLYSVERRNVNRESGLRAIESMFGMHFDITDEDMKKIMAEDFFDQ